MAILDRFRFGGATALVGGAPPAGISMSGTTTVNIAPDYGNGPAGSTRKASLWQSSPHDLLFHIRITADFAAVLGAASEPPTAQFHVVGTTQPAGGVINYINDNFATLGSNCGPLNLTTLGPPIEFEMGYEVADLTAGTQFFIRCNPWAPIMGRNVLTNTAFEGQDIRSLAVACYNPGFYDGRGFSSGIYEVHVAAASDIMDTPQDNTWPAGTLNV